MRGVNGVLGLVSRHEPDGILSRTQLSGSMVIWVAILLAVYLILSFW
jgi:multicomponent Na+:H+ antiporter subunit D